MSEKTFLTVERRVSGLITNGSNEGDGSGNVSRDGSEPEEDWKVIATDTNFETRFIWKRINYLTGTSTATVVWKIPPETPSGFYRIRHFGAHKTLMQNVIPYYGTSKVFKVVPE